jgi:hypothetical protein
MSAGQHKRSLSPAEREDVLQLLKERFHKNTKRHPAFNWSEIQSRLEAQPLKLWSLHQMEITGGEPDVISRDDNTGEYLFFDCSAESPAGRRSLCYDRKALDERKEHKPVNSAVDMAANMGIELLNEEQYRQLQNVGKFDMKTSSWLQTPPKIRDLGGAIFGDFRYNTVFVYHNGAQSYYAARGFRGLLKV